MSLGEILLDLRKKKGLSQEEAAEQLHVTRQTISKWETGQSTPDFDKLVPISRLYDISLDELAENGRFAAHADETAVLRLPRFHYEYKSRRSVGGFPLVHVNIGCGAYRAKGIVAVGNLAKGVVSVGLLSMGVLSFGVLSLGLLALGCLTAGLLAAGAIAVGGIAVGAIAVGLLAIGGVAVGLYALGGVAVAGQVALGGYANGRVAIGEKAAGAVRLLTDSHFRGVSPDEVRAAITRGCPGTPGFLAELFASLVG